MEVKKIKINIVIIFIFVFMATILPVKADIAPPPLSTFYIYINKKGQIVFPNQEQKKAVGSTFRGITRSGEFHEGLTLKRENGNWGFIDENNNWVIEPKFPSIICYNNGISDMQREDSYCKGETIFSEGLAPIKYKAKPKVRLEYQSKERYDAVFDVEIDKNAKYNNEVYGTIEGDKFHIKLLTKELPGIIYPNRYTTEPLTVERYEAMKKLKKGYFYNDYKIGYINKKGEVVIDASEYKEILPFSDGVAAVRKYTRGRYGYIDKTGKTIIKASDFNNCIAKVEVYAGNILWKFSLVLLTLIILISISIKKDMKRQEQTEQNQNNENKTDNQE